MKQLNFKKSMGLFLFSMICIFAHPLVQAAEEKQAYLFVHSAVEGIISENKDQKDSYILVLKQVNPYLTYFSDRPARKSGSINIEKFLGLWEQKGKNNFKEDAPNAGLHGVINTANNTTIDYALELTNPRYDAATKTLTYIVKPLEGTAASFPKSAELQHVTLFIDDACLSCF